MVKQRSWMGKFLQRFSSSKTLIILLVIFVSVSVFFALNLERGIIPDEKYHFSVSKIYATSWGIPADTPDTYYLGNLGNRPFLYHWINARILNMVQLVSPNQSDWRKLIALRLVNVVYSIGTVLYFYLLVKEIINNKWYQVFGVLLLTHSLMFVFDLHMSQTK